LASEEQPSGIRRRDRLVFSPDGQWVAYASFGASAKTIYVQSFPVTGDPHQLPQGAVEPKHPLWSADGTQLFYNPGPGQFESVSVTTQPTFAFGKHVAVPRPFPGAAPSVRRPYDITPDGRFVSAIPAGQSASGRPTAPQIQVVLNWFEELKTRAPFTRSRRRRRGVSALLDLVDFVARKDLGEDGVDSKIGD
jgi:hypothetical protein